MRLSTYWKKIFRHSYFDNFNKEIVLHINNKRYLTKYYNAIWEKCYVSVANYFSLAGLAAFRDKATTRFNWKHGGEHFPRWTTGLRSSIYVSFNFVGSGKLLVFFLLYMIRKIKNLSIENDLN